MYLFVGMLTTLPSLAIASGGILSPHAVLFHAIVSAIVIVFMIYYRSKRLEEKRAVDFALHAQNASNERTKREEQSRFFEMLTHEFKTSLAVLKMAFGSIDLGAKESRYANHAVDSMNDVIERCLQLQSLNDGQVQVNFDDINLCDLIGSFAKSARSSERIQLDCANVLMVKSDEKLLKVMLSNLIDNALKYSDPETFVNVRVESISDEVKVTVSNKVGHAGMPDQARIFDKYYRSERAHKQIGSGLGLYLTSQFANMLGMKLNYVPKPELVEFELCLKRSI
jgi:signal transduction histidine kinase